MKRDIATGFTLVELLVSLTTLALISVAATALLQACLQAQQVAAERTQLSGDALRVMEGIGGRLRYCTRLRLPNGNYPTTTILAFSGNTNDDGDFYGGDSRFPRCDEDSASDMQADDRPGVAGYDDDGDLRVDERLDNGTTGIWYPEDTADDDEDGSYNEDPLDGLDNDADGTIDEDQSGDMTADGKPGIRGFDDDADGTVDEDVGIYDLYDDDEDGLLSEDPENVEVYAFDRATGMLSVHTTDDGKTLALLDHVTQFDLALTDGDRLRITIGLSDGAHTVVPSEVFCLRNNRQRGGRRVR